MILLYVVLVIAIIFLAWRVNHPGDLRINRRYLARHLKDAQGQGPVRTRLNKLPIDRARGSLEERAYFHVDAQFADASKQSVAVQIIYPLEELHQERERRNAPSNQESGMGPGNMSDLQHGSDLSTRFTEDPFKDLTEEEKMMAMKAKQSREEAEHLRILSLRCPLFPRLLVHDEQRFITITEAVGEQRLDDLWQELDTTAKRTLLIQLVQDLASLHSRSHDLAPILGQGPTHNERAMLEALYVSLNVALKLETEDIQQANNAADPLFATAQLEQGARLANASPRGFFVMNNRARSLHWSGLRQDVSALDLVELVCDPALGLTATEELDFFTAYVDRLAQLTADDEAESLTLSDVRHLAIYFQLVLLGHLALFQQSPNAVGAKNPLGIKHWPQDSSAQVARKVLDHLAATEDLQSLERILAPALQRLL